jgi:enamine deaminase RidA (YjgF/YER057c/UK114 family)
METPSSAQIRACQSSFNFVWPPATGCGPQTVAAAAHGAVASCAKVSPPAQPIRPHLLVPRRVTIVALASAISGNLRDPQRVDRGQRWQFRYSTQTGSPRYRVSVWSPSGTGSRFVAIAGQVGRDLDGTWAEGLGGQFAKALSKLSIALASAGASAADVLKMTVYVVGWREEMGGALLEGALSFADAGGLIDPPAAWTLVGVQSLYEDRCLVEVEALALLD